jgi:hypothetical protein
MKAVGHRRSSKQKDRPRAAHALRHALKQTPGALGTRSGLPDLRIKKPISGRPEIGAQFRLWIFSYTAIFACARVMFGVF